VSVYQFRLMLWIRHCTVMVLTGLSKTPEPGSTRKMSPSYTDRRRHPLNSALRQLASWTSFIMVCMQPLTGHVGGLGGLQPVPCMAGQCDLDRTAQQLQQPPIHDASSVQHDQPISERQVMTVRCIVLHSPQHQDLIYIRLLNASAAAQVISRATQ
jgi:hypothetical protein